MRLHSMVLLLRKQVPSRNFSQQVDSRMFKREQGLVVNHPACTHIHSRRSRRGSCVSNTDTAAPGCWTFCAL